MIQSQSLLQRYYLFIVARKCQLKTFNIKSTFVVMIFLPEENLHIRFLSFMKTTKVYCALAKAGKLACGLRHLFIPGVKKEEEKTDNNELLEICHNS